MSGQRRKSPNAITGSSEILQTPTFGPLGSDQYIEYANDINESGHYLLNLVNDVLDLAKLEAGHFRFIEDEVALTGLTEDVIRQVKAQADAAGITLHFNCTKNLPRLHGDARALKQVLLNILSNATKFTKTTGQISIDLRTHTDGGLLITVKDDGIGISPEQLRTIREPFVQADHTFHHRFEGTGLGLPLASRLVELHGGLLDLQSETNIGATVAISFPPQRTVALKRART